MAIKHVRIGEVDTPTEVAKALNKIIDNLNLLEVKLEQLIASAKKVKETKKGNKDA